MDEIEWMKRLKKFLKYFNIFILGYIMLWLMIIFIKCVIHKNTNVNIAAFGNFIIIMFIFAISINTFFALMYAIIYLIYKLNYVKIDIEFNKEYIRELYKYYPPAIVSLIYDLKTEVYRDYTSTILYLYTKKYVNIFEFNENVKIDKGENENLSNLLKHELYVYNCIIYKQRFNENTFKKLIFEDAKEKELLIEEKDENKKEIKLILILLTMLIVLTSILRISDNAIWKLFITMILTTVIAILCISPIIMKYTQRKINNYKLAKKGKQELKKIKAFKNFIKDYTLVEEKDIEYVQILEEYIPYSLSLGMLPQVEKYIKENEIYRNLIYEGRN